MPNASGSGLLTHHRVGWTPTNPSKLMDISSIEERLPDTQLTEERNLDVQPNKLGSLRAKTVNGSQVALGGWNQMGGSNPPPSSLMAYSSIAEQQAYILPTKEHNLVRRPRRLAQK